MILMKPVTLTDAMIGVGTAVDFGVSSWASGTTYALGAMAAVTGLKGAVTYYESLQAGNLNHAPASSPAWWKMINQVYLAYNSATAYAVGDRAQDNTNHLVYEAIAANTNVPFTDTTKWVLVGPSNKYAAFDDSLGTLTSTSSPMVIKLSPGSVDSVGFMELSAYQLNVKAYDTPGGTVVFDETKFLDGAPIDSFYDWFFSPFDQTTDVVVSGIPTQFTNCELVITLRSNLDTTPVSVGLCKPGKSQVIGVTQYGSSVGITDYSKKEFNTFGGVSVLERAYSKRGSFQMETELASFNRIFKLLASVRATPCFYLGGDYLTGFQPMLIYGFYKDFSIVVSYFDTHLCSLEIEGLT